MNLFLISVRFTSNSEAIASELLEISQGSVSSVLHIDMFSMFKSLTTPLYVIRRVMVNNIFSFIVFHSIVNLLLFILVFHGDIDKVAEYRIIL